MSNFTGFQKYQKILYPHHLTVQSDLDEFVERFSDDILLFLTRLSSLDEEIIGIEIDILPDLEISLDIELEDMTFFFVIITACPQEPAYPLDSKTGSFAFPAAVAVVYEYPVENRIDVVVDEMVDDPVTKSGSEDFPFYGMVLYEIYASRYLIISRG